MSLQPYYEPDSVTPCYKLRYGWVGWPTGGTQFPKEMEHHLSAPAKGWEEDGIRLLETRFSPERVLMTFSVKPSVAPTLVTARVKGRLQHAFREAGLGVKFSRKLAMQSIGENHREDVEAYIANQIERESWADPRIMQVLCAVHGDQSKRRFVGAGGDCKRSLLVQSASRAGNGGAMAEQRNTVADEDSRSVVPNCGEERARHFAIVGHAQPLVMWSLT